MDIKIYSKEIYVLNLTPAQHLKVTVNKHGRKKFKLKRPIKRLLKSHGISYYFLWGNDMPIQVVLRGATPEAITFLSLL